MTGERQIIEARYYNANYHACAIVAVVTKGVDWTAYISGCPADISEQKAVEFTAQKGCKLSEMDARHFFPKDLYPEIIGLPYRK